MQKSEYYRIKTSHFLSLLYTHIEDFLLSIRTISAHKITVELLQDIAHVGRK